MLDQAQMVQVLSACPKLWWRDDVGRGVHPLTASERILQYDVQGCNVERRERDNTECVLDELPRLRFVEEAVEQCPQQDVFSSLRPLILNTNEILRHPVGCAIGVREAVSRQDWIIRPRAGRTFETSVVYSLSLSGHEPIASQHVARHQGSRSHSNRSHRTSCGTPHVCASEVPT